MIDRSKIFGFFSWTVFAWILTGCSGGTIDEDAGGDDQEFVQEKEQGELSDPGSEGGQEGAEHPVDSGSDVGLLESPDGFEDLDSPISEQAGIGDEGQACVPNCVNKKCGSDGCTGLCPNLCAADQVCSDNDCVCDSSLPEGWPAAFTVWAYNPILVPSSNSFHGSDNIYAPDIVRFGNILVMWYGGQGGDGHDRIFMAWSVDGLEWRKYPSGTDPRPALEVGSSNHVNDPSVVRVGSTWYMYYTDAPVGIDDRIWLATSTDLIHFQKVAEVLGPGPQGSWESQKVGRPAVLFEEGTFKMWYDGNDGTHRHVGYATSSDGIAFTRHPGNPIVLNAGAIDVDKIGGVYVMLHESGNGTYWLTSRNGTCWVNRGKLFGLSGAAYDRYGQVTPFLQVEQGQIKAIWFGGASVSGWNRNRIAAAYPVDLQLPAEGGGCSGCLTGGVCCSEACHGVGTTSGTCAFRGSTTAGKCCRCFDDGCENCIGSAHDCDELCVAGGHAAGWCATPGSTDPANCCTCAD